MVNICHLRHPTERAEIEESSEPVRRAETEARLQVASRRGRGGQGDEEASGWRRVAQREYGEEHDRHDRSGVAGPPTTSDLLPADVAGAGLISEIVGTAALRGEQGNQCSVNSCSFTRDRLGRPHHNTNSDPKIKPKPMTTSSRSRDEPVIQGDQMLGRHQRPRATKPTMASIASSP
jgi:hypothetical protein